MKNSPARVVRKIILVTFLMMLVGALGLVRGAPSALASSGGGCNFNGDVGACISISGNTIHSYAWLVNGGYSGCTGVIELFQQNPMDGSGWHKVQSFNYSCPSGNEHGDMYYPHAIPGYWYYVDTSSGQEASSPLLVALF